jgi:hypothetical protein
MPKNTTQNSRERALQGRLIIGDNLYNQQPYVPLPKKKYRIERIACGSITGNSFNTSFLYLSVLAFNGAGIAFRCRAL